MSYALGIDLGTTYTAAATVRAGWVEVMPLGNRAATIPTVVFFGEDGVCKVGEAAEQRGISSPGRFAREIKARLGDTTPLVLGATAWSPEALLGEVLRYVVDTTAEHEGSPPEQIGLTHPASWGPYKLDLFTQAVRLAGLRVERYLSEPEAVALAYATMGGDRVPKGAIVAVYDLGGGTFDATVLRLGREGFEILGNPEGIERFGGIHVDETVLAHVRTKLHGALESLDLSDPAVVALLARLRADCVVGKERLSSDTEVSIPVTLPNLATEVRLTRAELDAAIAVPIDRTIAALRGALASAGVAPERLHAVLLVGGSSRMPIVADAVSHAVGRRVAIGAHPEFGVAMGAALAAAPVRPQVSDT